MECLEKQSLLVHGANDRTSEARNGSASTLIAFECECGDLYCWETISLSRRTTPRFELQTTAPPFSRRAMTTRFGAGLHKAPRQASRKTLS
jgi:hypothetical protein